MKKNLERSEMQFYQKKKKMARITQAENVSNKKNINEDKDKNDNSTLET